MTQKTKLPLLLRLARKFDFPRKLGILERLFGQKLSRSGICWVECANGVSWKLDLDDPCHRWIVFGKYEGGSGIDLAFSTLKDGGVYIDSGANIGQWLLYLGHIKGLKSLAFEPVSSQRSWLYENVSAQNDWDVDIFEYGLGSESIEVDIQVNGARSTLKMDWYKGKGYVREKIDIQPLADVLENLQIDMVDFWKLDTEGAELDALIGAKKYLQDRKIKAIYFECHPSNYSEIVALFTSCGYGVFNLVGSQLVLKTDTCIPETQDLVAVPL